MTAVETRSPSHQQLLREENHGNYLISTDPAKLDISIVHGYLTRSYWAAQISESIQQRAIANSLCFGIYHKLSDKFSQVGFARVITDYATIAYIADVFVLEEHRGKGLSKLLVRMILSHPELQNLRRWLLVTKDAHGLYSQFGFRPLAAAERHMEMTDFDVYKRLASQKSCL